MSDNTKTDRSRELILAANRALNELIRDATQGKIYGSIQIQLSFEDGTARTLRQNLERIVK